MGETYDTVGGDSLDFQLGGGEGEVLAEKVVDALGDIGIRNSHFRVSVKKTSYGD